MTMVCDCGKKMKCTDSRQRSDKTIWRRHACKCGVSFTTIETREIEKSASGRGKALKIKTSVTDIELNRIEKLMDEAVIAIKKLQTNSEGEQ